MIAADAALIPIFPCLAGPSGPDRADGLFRSRRRDLLDG